MEKAALSEKDIANSPTSEKHKEDAITVEGDTQMKISEEPNSLDTGKDCSKLDKVDAETDAGESIDESSGLEFKCPGDNVVKHDDLEPKSVGAKLNNDTQHAVSGDKKDEEVGDLEPKAGEGNEQTPEEILGEQKEPEPVFDGTEVPGMEANRSTSFHSSDADPEGSAWPEKAMALKNFVKEKGAVAVTSVLRVLSVKRDEVEQVTDDEDKEASDSAKDKEVTEVSHKPADRSAWNPLSYIMFSRDDAENNFEQGVEGSEEPLQPIAMKGRIILYTRLGCQDCKEVRLFLHRKRLRYVEINIDVYPSRKLELEKFTGSSTVPKVFFNEIVIGGLAELNGLDESGKLGEKIDYLITEAPASEAPLPPLSGEDDASTSGSIDELALIVRKMKESIVVKDRFYKMRRFTSCFIGSEAVDFLSEDQYLERDEATEFGRKLVSELFFRHILDENIFEDGNHLYRFLDNDPIVSSQCYNIPRGIVEAKPKPITEIAARLRFLSCAIFEAYTSVDGKHVDYRSIHGSEEFARYLRIIQELQRVELLDMEREEKLAFFINLYNMMAIHAILVLGFPKGALERRKLFGDFQYVIGGCSYSLSAIQNGILRGNQRPPYNLTKPFGVKDKRSKVALPYAEPLIHFALVCGTRSGPALRCFSPGDIDKELMEAARDFLRGGGLIIDFNAKTALVSKILKWFSVDFGKNEMEVLKHSSNYLEPTSSETLLGLLDGAQLKVMYQPYDWGVNN